MTTLSQERIKELIPHRSPFLWLDAAEIDGETLTASAFVSPDLPLFEGHYPGAPLLPGVIQLEMCFQAGAVLIAQLGRGAGGVPVIARTDGVKFKRMVRPGETCEIEVVITHSLPGVFYLTGKLSVDGKLACRCDFTTAEAKLEAIAG